MRDSELRILQDWEKALSQIWFCPLIESFEDVGLTLEAVWNSDKDLCTIIRESDSSDPLDCIKEWVKWKVPKVRVMEVVD